MKKFLIFCSTACVPFILVWMGFILTAFSFSPQDVFHSGSFWGLSCMYWFLWLCLSPLIMETINEIHDKKPVVDKKEQVIQKHLNNHAKYTKVTPEYEAFVRDALDKI